jgi:outer membrane protein TolC
LIIIFLSSQAVVLHSQTDSLNSYLQTAAKSNPTVLQKYYEYEAALQKVPQAGALQDPQLTLGIFTSPMELVAGNQVADIKLMQMFPWFGTLKAAKDEMSLMAKAKFESFRDSKLQVFFDVQSTWYELYKLDQEIRISRKNVDILKVIDRLALTQFRTAATNGRSSSGSGMPQSSNQQGITQNNQGMGGMQNQQTPSQNNGSSSQGGSMEAISGSGLPDLYRIQIEIGDLENNIALLQNQKNTALAKFNSFLNREVMSPVSIADTLVPDTLNLSLSAVSDSMLMNNPMLGMLQYEGQSIDARKKMVTRMGRPMLGIGLDYSLIQKSNMSASDMNGKDMVMPMVTVTLPVYRNKYKSMRKEADMTKSANKFNYEATANSLKNDYYSALQLYQDAARRIKLYQNQYELAKKSLDIMIKSFSASAANLSDILRIRQQTLDYELKKVEAVVDYNTSIAWLRRLGSLN